MKNWRWWVDNYFALILLLSVVLGSITLLITIFVKHLAAG